MLTGTSRAIAPEGPSTPGLRGYLPWVLASMFPVSRAPLIGTHGGRTPSDIKIINYAYE
jgi:hypothetical protein